MKNGLCQNTERCYLLAENKNDQFNRFASIKFFRQTFYFAIDLNSFYVCLLKVKQILFAYNFKPADTFAR